MTTEQRSAMLREVVESLDPNIDERESPLQIFLPLRMHVEMLDDAVLVVEGERGAGKTALFRFLDALRQRNVPLPAVFTGVSQDSRVWLTGFEERGTEHPARQALTTWGTDQPDEALEHFWLGHLVGRLGSIHGLPPAPPLTFLTTWDASRSAVGTWVPQVAGDLGAIYGWLDRVQRSLEDRRVTLMVGYDELDRLSTDGHLALPGRFSATLVRLWLGLRRRLARLRAKIFLRPDLFARVKTSTVDASKLDGHVVRLGWTSEDVFRVLLRRLFRGAELRRWLEADEPGLRAQVHEVLGYLPPHHLPEAPLQQSFAFMPQQGAVELRADKPTQETLARLLAGTYMGSGPNKGLTHRWILNHSSDGLKRALPRVTLNLIRNAARGALDRAVLGPGETLVSPSDLEAAQTETGQQRLAELRESHPVVWRMEHLRHEAVPMDLDQATRALAEPHPDHPDDHADGAAAFTTLVHLGVMLKREPAKGQTRARADVPDLLRRPLEIKRHGGPLQIKAR